MTSSIRHQPTRSTAGVAIAGRPGWTTLRPPGDLELAAHVRRYALTELPGRTVTAGADPDRTALARIASRYPTAEDTFGRPALLALTRRPGGRGVCGFCRATVTAAGLGEPAPNPTAPALQALLGRPCRRCQERQRTSEHVAAVRGACRVEQGLLDEPDVPALAARIGYWGELLRVPGAIKGAAIADALHPRRRWPTGRITSVGGRR
jgi:hypothetical protein